MSKHAVERVAQWVVDVCPQRDFRDNPWYWLGMFDVFVFGTAAYLVATDGSVRPQIRWGYPAVYLLVNLVVVARLVASWRASRHEARHARRSVDPAPPGHA